MTRQSWRRACRTVRCGLSGARCSVRSMPPSACPRRFSVRSRLRLMRRGHRYFPVCVRARACESNSRSTDRAVSIFRTPSSSELTFSSVSLSVCVSVGFVHGTCFLFAAGVSFVAGATVPRGQFVTQFDLRYGSQHAPFLDCSFAEVRSPLLLTAWISTVRECCCCCHCGCCDRGGGVRRDGAWMVTRRVGGWVGDGDG